MDNISTYNLPKAAGHSHYFPAPFRAVSTHSRLKAAVAIGHRVLNPNSFQHTAA